MAADLEQRILDLLGRRAPSSSICPSDVARDVAPDDWRPLMQPVRDAAARLADAGRVVVTQGDDVVDVRTARGPVRIRGVPGGRRSGG